MRNKLFSFATIAFFFCFFFIASQAQAQNFTGDPVKKFERKEKRHDAAEAKYLKNPTEKNHKKFVRKTHQMAKAVPAMMAATTQK